MRRIINEANNEIMARCNEPSELGEVALSAEEMQWMRNNQDEFFYSMGLLDPNNKTNSIPRLFVLGADENGESKVFDLSQVDIKAGSDEFWKQVQRGNVFAYPAGQDDPVQIQVGVSESGGLKLGTSKPVTTENLPDPPVYKLNMWQKFASWFGFYKKEVHMAEHRAEEQQSLKGKLDLMQTVRKHSNKAKEVEDVQEGERILKEREDAKALEELQKNKDALKLGMKVMTDVFIPQPRFNPDLEKILDGPGKREGLYTKKHFNSLKVYDKNEIDPEKIQIGGGKKLTEEEFASVTMYALWNPKNSMKGYNQMAPDIHGEKSLTELGFSKEEIPTLLTSRSRGWWSTDLFIQPKPRDNEGSYFKDVTNSGRKDAVEAFQAYKDGDKNKLAQIIADGVNMAADDMKVVDGTKLTDQQHAVIVTSGKLVDLMEKDPELKSLALQKGMKKDHLKAVEGNRALHKMIQDAKDAEYEIKKAKIEGRDLSAEDKAKYAKAMVKPKIALSRLVQDNEIESPEAEEKVAILGVAAKPVNKLDSQAWSKDPSKRTSPGKGKIWMDTMQHCLGSVYKVYRPLPQSLGELSAQKGLDTLDKIADQIVRQEDMAQKSTEWLANEIDKPTVDMVKSTIQAVNKIANPKKEDPAAQQPQAQTGPKKLDANKINMFEPKKNEGPQGPVA